MISAALPYKHWHVVKTVELGAPAADVWAVVGGFYTIHRWHPDIESTEVPKNQTEVAPLRRELSFAGQPTTVEELICMDPKQFMYTYRWYAGAWGERVQQYVASLRLFEIADGQRSVLQWSSTFYYTEDALTKFYWNGFRALQKQFPLVSNHSGKDHGEEADGHDD